MKNKMKKEKWSKVFKGFVCINREQCTKNIYLPKENE